MTLREAAQQAREILRYAADALSRCGQATAVIPCIDAINALEAALEQEQKQEQEPASWIDLRKAARQALEALDAGPDVDPIYAGETIAALRAALAEPEAKQSAYAYMYISLCDAMGYSECKGARMYSPEEWAAHLYAKTQKTQKTLTDEEIDALKGEVWGSSGIAPRSASAFARAIEAALKERNK